MESIYTCLMINVNYFCYHDLIWVRRILKVLSPLALSLAFFSAKLTQGIAIATNFIQV